MFEKYDEKYIADLLEDHFAPYPDIDDRKSWEGLPDEVKDGLIKNAEEFLDFNLEPLTAALFMEYFKTGSNKNYSDLFKKRRFALCCLTGAECAANSGRYLKDIVNILWALCEQSTWAEPNHNYVLPDNGQTDAGCLPDPEKPIFDLFAGETGALVSYACYLLKPRLNEISPLLVKRIELEVKKRIIDPYLGCDTYLWMLFRHYDGVLINNWTSWCTSNALTSVLLIEQDNWKKACAIAKALRSLDRYIATYQEEGGCNEGPEYWYFAAGCVFDILYAIYTATGRKLNLFEKNQKIANMGRYVTHMHIAKDYFVSYADGDARLNHCAWYNFSPERIHVFGKMVQDADMQNLAAELLRCRETHPARDTKLNHYLMEIFHYSGLKERKIPPEAEKAVFMKDLQIVCVKEKEGFFLSVKGGNNAESHNHNDLGNFVIYYREEPVVVDMGVGLYTRKHWGKQRYEMMTTRSSCHNVPTVNNTEQMPGKEFKIDNMTFAANETGYEVMMDLGKAYPPQAEIESWKREYRLIKGSRVTVCDTGTLKKPVELMFSFITPVKPVFEKGRITLGSIVLSFDEELFVPSHEELKLDEKLKVSWDQLFRIVLRSRMKMDRIAAVVDFSPVQ